MFRETYNAGRKKRLRQGVSVIGVLIAVTLFSAAPALAVIILHEGEPIRGYLRSKTRTSITIDELLPSGATRPRTFRLDQVTVIESIDRERLEGLREEDPGAYRSYADDLSEKTRDPDVLQTVMRLYLIAAYLDPEIRVGCLRSMAHLAQDPVEQRKFLALAYTLDPRHERSLLRAAEEKVEPSAIGSEQSKLLVRGLRALWAGRRADARRFAEQPDFVAAMESLGEFMTMDEFNRALDAVDGWIPPQTLAKILAVEELVSPSSSTLDRRDEDGAQSSWAAVQWTRPSRATMPLRLETITPYDPRQTRYRRGEWVRPR